MAAGQGGSRAGAGVRVGADVRHGRAIFLAGAWQRLVLASAALLDAWGRYFEEWERRRRRSWKLKKSANLRKRRRLMERTRRPSETVRVYVCLSPVCFAAAARAQVFCFSDMPTDHYPWKRTSDMYILAYTGCCYAAALCASYFEFRRVFF